MQGDLVMNENDKYKKIEKLGWELFSKTGDIDFYGVVVSARELEKEKEQQNSFEEEREM